MRATRDDSTWDHDMMDGGRQMMDGSGSEWGIAFAVIALVLLALVLLAAVASLLLHLRRGPTPVPGSGTDADPRLVLDGRLARGEVSAEDYRAARALLERT